MNVLAFDTCLGAVSAALRWRSPGGEWLLSHRFERRRCGHAERLMPMIKEIMEEARLAISSLDRLAVTIGPGTFTGVRVGVAAARGLGLASGLPVVGASSLAVMAHGANERLGRAGHEPLAVAIDARRGMVYFQLFGQGEAPAALPLLLPAEDAVPLIGTRPLVVAGSGARDVVAAVAAAGGKAEAQLPDLEPHAKSLAQIAESLEPVAALRPLYLRPPDVKPPAGKALSRAPPP